MPSTDLPSSAASALLADYQFSEGSGTTVADSSGNSAAAVFAGTNPPIWIAGKGVQIQADPSYLTCPVSNAGVQTVLVVMKALPYNSSSMSNFVSVIGNSSPNNFQWWLTTQNVAITSNSARNDWYGLWSWANAGDGPSEGGVAPGSVACLGWVTQPAGAGGDNYWIDGQKWTAGGSDSSASNRGGTIQIGGSAYGASVCPVGAIYSRVVFYSRALTDAEMSAAMTALQAFATGRGYAANDSCNPQTVNKFAAEGDSITYGYINTGSFRMATPWPAGMTTAATYQRDNFGIYGQQLSKMLASGFNKIKKDYSPNAAKNVVAVFGGTNDMTSDSSTATTTFNNLVSLVNLYLGQGWRVIVVPTVSNVNHDATGAAYNALIAGHTWPANVQVLPTSALPNLCGTGLYSNTTYFCSDGVHPTQAGANQIAAAIGPLVDAAYSATGLVSGSLSATSDTASSVGLAMSAISGGTSPYSTQLQRSPHSAGTWTNVGPPVAGASPSFTDATVAAATAYDYRGVVTDSSSPAALSASSAILAVSTPASAATSYTFSGPSSGVVGTASSSFTVTPNGPDTGTITVTPVGGGLSTPTVLTFSGSNSPQTFTITPTSAGAITLTPTNNSGLANPAALTYSASPVLSYATLYQVPDFPSAPVVGETYAFTYTLDGPASALGAITPTAQAGITWGPSANIAAGGTHATGTVTFTVAGTYTPAFTHSGLGFSGNPTLSSVTAAVPPGMTGVYPSPGDVRLSTVYGPTSNKTGTLSVPTAAQVLASVAVDATVGTVVLPTASQVRSGVAFGPGSGTTGTYSATYTAAANVRSGTDRGDGTMGTLNVPTASQVLASVAVDATVGTVVLPTASQVRSGVAFGPGSGTTGTYSATYTAAANVRSGTDRGDGTMGTLNVPTASQVLASVAVDATTGNVVLPPAAQVATGVPFGPGSSLTGTYAGSGGGGATLAQITTLLAAGVNLTPSGLDAIQVEPGINARQALSPILAASAGIVSGAGTGVIVLKGGNTTTTRIAATTDNVGNRTSVTLTLPN